MSSIKHLSLLGICALCIPAGFSQNRTEAEAVKQSNWQQQVNHSIETTLDTGRKMLLCNETIVYTNNSPDALQELWLHVWPNAFKNNATAYGREAVAHGNRTFFEAPKKDRGFLDSMQFSVDGLAVPFDFHPDYSDIIKIKLPAVLQPGKSVRIYTPFRVKLPYLFSRQGINGKLLAITQWYPKPAVYDVNGWNYFPYLEQGEYYSEFGTYDVKITVPAEFKVAATGELQNPEEMEWLKKQSQGVADSALRTGWKTLQFTQDNIPDFAWFANPDFEIAMGKTKVGKDSVNTYAFYYNSKKKGILGRLSGETNGQGIVEDIGTALEYYSKRVGKYPYKNCTVVYGPLEQAGGMEYPMITICGDVSSGTVIHEVGHNWFQCILGSNERRYPWMDESINTFYHQQADGKTEKQFSPGDKASFSGNYQQLRLSQDLGNYQAGNMHSAAYQKTNYGTIVYAGNPLRFMYLQEYLGVALFDSCMKKYFETWKFKHPLPDDIKLVFETVSRKDLSWFFDGFLGGAMPDLRVKKVIRKKDAISVSIKSNLGYRIPYKLAYLEGTKRKDIWLSGGDTTIQVPKNAAAISLNPTGYLPESNIANNDARTRGIFKTFGNLKFGFPGLYRRNENKVWFLPIFYAWNRYDGYMPGLVLSNMNFPRRKWEWWATPMFGVKSKTYAGYAGIRRNIFHQNGPFAVTEIEGKYARFGLRPMGDSSGVSYNRFSIGATSLLKRTHPYIQDIFEIDYSVSRLDRSNFKRSTDGGDTSFYYPLDLQNDVLRIAFTRNVYKKLRPRAYRLQIEGGNNKKPGNASQNTLEIAPFRFIKITAVADLFMEFSHKKFRNMGFRVKGYGEAFAYQQSSTYYTNGYFNPVVSGANGNNDYAYRQTMNGRSEVFGSQTFFSQQLLTYGNGVRMLPNITANQWVAGVNMQSHFLPKIPIELFFDCAMAGTTKKSWDNYWVGGLACSIHSGNITNFEVTVPLLYSSNFDNLVKGFEWYQLIAFRVNIGIWSPYKFARNAYQ